MSGPPFRLLLAEGGSLGQPIQAFFWLEWVIPSTAPLLPIPRVCVQDPLLQVDFIFAARWAREARGVEHHKLDELWLGRGSVPEPGLATASRANDAMVVRGKPGGSAVIRLRRLQQPVVSMGTACHGEIVPQASGLQKGNTRLPGPSSNSRMVTPVRPRDHRYLSCGKGDPPFAPPESKDLAVVYALKEF